MSKHDDLFIIRPYDHENDHKFIYATWLRGLYSGNYLFSKMPKSVFMSNYHDIIENILKSPLITIKVCAFKEDPGVIIGYSVYSQSALYWVFVKKAWQNIGVAKDLVPSTINTVNQLTYSGVSILKTHPHLTYNPFEV